MENSRNHINLAIINYFKRHSKFDANDSFVSRKIFNEKLDVMYEAAIYDDRKHAEMMFIGSKYHKIETDVVVKFGLCNYDNKRYFMDGINTYVHGHVKHSQRNAQRKHSDNGKDENFPLSDILHNLSTIWDILHTCLRYGIFYTPVYAMGYSTHLSTLWDILHTCLPYGICYTPVYHMEYSTHLSTLCDILHTCLPYGICYTPVYAMRYSTHLSTIWNMLHTSLPYGIFYTPVYAMGYSTHLSTIWNMLHTCLPYGIFYTPVYAMGYSTHLSTIWNMLHTCLPYGIFYTPVYAMVG
ncbi:hypothetical protein CHS0354_002869 [Potamilus streckersoni]|uniref:Uncharacterized protein n=1 Tax=Potamilus streckersoni TaxID=2493646 RepID=A0AAE0VY09_9BIVA|nr:hypothetical protein CHS0354_002869 [Potamilus streckersoni]